MFKSKKNKHKLASTELKQMNVSTLRDSTNLGGSLSSTSSLSHVNGSRKYSERIEAIERVQEELGLSVLSFKKPSKVTTSGTEELTDTRVSMESLTSFGSASSKQRIIMNGKPPRDFNRINIQSNYDARRESDNGRKETTHSFGAQAYDSKIEEDAVSISNRQGGKYRVVEEDENRASSGSNPNLSKSLRDVIREKRRPQRVRDSDTDTTKSDSSSRRTSQVPEQKKTKGVPASMRVCIFCVVLLMCAAGIGLLIHFLRKSESPDVPTTDTATCITEGVNFGKNFTIICDTTFKNVSNISIFVVYSPRNDSFREIKLSSQKPNSSDWALNYTFHEDATTITLIGPPANCNSVGEYNISITSTATKASFLKSITVEVKGNLILNTSNTNCSNVICQSLAQCKRGCKLQMSSSDSACNTSCSDFCGCTERCNGTISSVIQDFTQNCTLFDTYNNKNILTTNITFC